MPKTAYVLLTCDVGKHELVKSDLKQVHEVKEVKRTYGVYDIIVKLTITNQDSLWNVISRCVKKHDNVQSALTLPVLDPKNQEHQILS